MAFTGDVRTAAIDTATAGDNTIVAAVPGKKIYVFGYTVVASGALAVRWKSGASTNMSGAMALAANGGLVVSGGADTVQMITTAGDALVLNLGGAVQASGHVTYGVR